jgi:isocitrate dehydrogenase
VFADMFVVSQLCLTALIALFSSFYALFWSSCCKAIRNILGGTIFRSPIICRNVPRLVRTWESPIVVARHAFGDQYRATDMLTHPSGGKLTMTFAPADGSTPVTREVVNLAGPGVALAMYNTDASIMDFARTTFEYASQNGLPLFLATKNTILKTYDGVFVSTFEKVAAEYPGVVYEHRLIDDFVASMVKSEGGYVVALKNYDGDVLSDIGRLCSSTHSPTMPVVANAGG